MTEIESQAARADEAWAAIVKADMPVDIALDMVQDATNGDRTHAKRLLVDSAGAWLRGLIPAISTGSDHERWQDANGMCDCFGSIATLVTSASHYTKCRKIAVRWSQGIVSYFTKPFVESRAAAANMERWRAWFERFSFAIGRVHEIVTGAPGHPAA